MHSDKDPKLVKAGLRGAMKRWGPARRVHIGDLSPARREYILATIEAERRAAARSTEAAP